MRERSWMSASILNVEKRIQPPINTDERRLENTAALSVFICVHLRPKILAVYWKLMEIFVPAPEAAESISLMPDIDTVTCAIWALRFLCTTTFGVSPS